MRLIVSLGVVSAAIALLLCLPAHAAVAGKIEKGRVQIVLLDTSEGACKVDDPPGVKNALWIEPRGQIKGCWMVKDGEVWLIFEDGDGGVLPVKAFTWAPGLQPARLM